MKRFSIDPLNVIFCLVAKITGSEGPRYIKCDSMGWEEHPEVQFRLLNSMEITINPNNQTPFYFEVKEGHERNDLRPRVETTTFVQFSTEREMFVEFQTSKTTKECFFVKHYYKDGRWFLHCAHRQETMIERKVPEPEIIKVEVIVPRRTNEEKHAGSHCRPQPKERREKFEPEPEVITPHMAEPLSKEQQGAIAMNCTGPLRQNLDLNEFKVSEGDDHELNEPATNGDPKSHRPRNSHGRFVGRTN